MFKRKLTDFLQDDSGATAIEYGLIAALIAIAMAAALPEVQKQTSHKLGCVNAAIDDIGPIEHRICGHEATR